MLFFSFSNVGGVDIIKKAMRAGLVCQFVMIQEEKKTCESFRAFISSAVWIVWKLFRAFGGALFDFSESEKKNNTFSFYSSPIGKNNILKNKIFF